MIVMGIDLVGTDGCFAYYDKEKNHINSITDLPQKDGVIDGRVFKNLVTSDTTLVCIEKPVHFTGEGGNVGRVCQNFENYGVVVGILISLGIDYFGVNPRVWKKKLELGSDKNLSIDLAHKLFPTQTNLFPIRKYHDKAEACLLAYYAATYGKPEEFTSLDRIKKGFKTKLTQFDVHDIRLKHGQGVTGKELAKQYSVNQNTISRIIHSKTWK